MLISLPSFELPNIIIMNWARKKWHLDKESDTEEANKKKCGGYIVLCLHCKL